jgi:hypothetical protein
MGDKWIKQIAVSVLPEVQRLTHEAAVSATQATAAATSAGACMAEAKSFSEAITSQAESIQKVSEELAEAAGETSSSFVQNTGIAAGVLGFVGGTILGVDAWLTPEGGTYMIDKASMRYRYNSYSNSLIGQKQLIKIAHYRGYNVDLSDLNFTTENKLVDPMKVEMELVKIDNEVTKLKKTLVNQEIIKVSKQLNMPHNLHVGVVLDAIKQSKK